MRKIKKLYFKPEAKTGYLNLVFKLQDRDNYDMPIRTFERSSLLKYWYRNINIYCDIDKKNKRIILSTNSNLYKNQEEIRDNRDRDTLFCYLYGLENAIEANYQLKFDSRNKLSISFQTISKVPDDIPENDVKPALAELKHLSAAINPELNNVLKKIKDYVQEQYGFKKTVIADESDLDDLDDLLDDIE